MGVSSGAGSRGIGVLMSEYDDLLLEAYRGEVLGAALFGAMADTEPDHGRREQLAALREVEAQTAARLQTLVETSGIDAGPDDSPRSDGVQLAEGAREQPWHDFLGGLRSALPAYLEKFERLQTIGAPDDPILAELVAHERAIDRFAELEREGRGADALAVLRAHLDASHGPPRVPDVRSGTPSAEPTVRVMNGARRVPHVLDAAHAAATPTCSGASRAAGGAAAASSVWLAFASDHVEEPAGSAVLEVWIVLGYVLGGIVGMVAPAEPLRSADGRSRFRVLPLEPVVVERTTALHHRDPVRSRSGRALPARVPRASPKGAWRRASSVC